MIVKNSEIRKEVKNTNEDETRKEKEGKSDVECVGGCLKRWVHTRAVMM